MNTEALNLQYLNFKDLLKLDKFFAPKSCCCCIG